MLLDLPFELVIKYIATLLEYESYCALRHTCRAMARALPVRDATYYRSKMNLVVRRAYGYELTGAPYVLNAFYHNGTELRRADGPCWIKRRVFRPECRAYRTSYPYMYALDRLCLLRRAGEALLDRKWIGYAMAPNPDGGVLVEDSLLCVRAQYDTPKQTLVLHQEYRDRAGSLHRVGGPAWIYNTPVRKRTLQGGCAYTTRRWVEEHWVHGQPRAQPGAWRILFFANEHVHEAWYYDARHRVHIVKYYSRNGTLVREQEIPHAEAVSRCNAY